MNIIHDFDNDLKTLKIALNNRLVSFFLGSRQNDVHFRIIRKKEKFFAI